MRTIKIKIYQFEELSEQAKEVAIEQIRNSYYEYNDFSEWAIDDCGLLEPPHKELEELFGQTYDFPLIKNNREVFFSSGKNRYIDISKAMEITNRSQFLKWLGVNFEIPFSIKPDRIIFDEDMEIEFSEEQENILGQAMNKFATHCESILKRIETDIDYRFTDEAIIEDIEGSEYEFLSNGKQYKSV